jgi:hypothetical protein
MQYLNCFCGLIFLPMFQHLYLSIPFPYSASPLILYTHFYYLLVTPPLINPLTKLTFSRSTGSNPSVNTILTSPHWRSTFTAADMTPQRGSTRRAACFGVPYSEHSSFRELTLFACGLRIGKFIPTVNVGSKNSRSRMSAWIDKWQAERRKAGGVVDVSEKW